MKGEKEGDKYGGSEDFSVYKERDTRPYCDQLAHLLRSIYWAPQHLKHWSKTQLKVVRTEKGSIPIPR